MSNGLNRFSDKIEAVKSILNENVRLKFVAFDVLIDGKKGNTVKYSHTDEHIWELSMSHVYAFHAESTFSLVLVMRIEPKLPI